MTVLALTGTIQAPAAPRCAISCASDGLVALSLVLNYEAELAEILSGTVLLNVQSQFVSLGLGAIDTLRFLALTIEEGQTGDVEILVGRVPTLLGSAGVFPLVTGGLLEFDLLEWSSVGAITTRFSVSATLAIGDTAAIAAAKINAAAALVGLTIPVASVVGGQIQLVGDRPGATQALQIETALAGAGFPNLVTPHGTGTAALVDRLFVASYGAAAGTRGADVWIRGGAATLLYVGAGS